MKDEVDKIREEHEKNDNEISAWLTWIKRWLIIYFKVLYILVPFGIVLAILAEMFSEWYNHLNWHNFF